MNSKIQILEGLQLLGRGTLVSKRTLSSLWVGLENSKGGFFCMAVVEDAATLATKRSKLEVSPTTTTMKIKPHRYSDRWCE